jgi:hypothetical protein
MKEFVLFIVSFLLYFSIEAILPGALFYIVGGGIGASLLEFFKMLGLTISGYYILVIWITMLVFTILAYFKCSNKYLTCFLMVFIAVLLTVVEFIFLEWSNKFGQFERIVIIAMIKSSVLLLIFKCKEQLEIGKLLKIN